MRKYPFQPEFLDALPEEIVSIYLALEDKLLEEICSRLAVSDKLNTVAVSAIKTLRSHGIKLKEIETAIKNTAKIGEEKLTQLFDDVVKRNQKYYEEEINFSDLTEPRRNVDKDDIEAVYKQSKKKTEELEKNRAVDRDDIKKGFEKENRPSKDPEADLIKEDRKKQEEKKEEKKVEQPKQVEIVNEEKIKAVYDEAKEKLLNLTKSAGFLVHRGGKTVMLPPAKAYQWALDQAVIRIDSGVTSYNEAIKDAIKELASSGIKTVSYESGHVDQLDVAVRRAVMTGVAQLCDQYTTQSAEKLGSHYFEISAHSGARDKLGPHKWSSHKAWQGKVYSTEQDDIYPNIYAECGYGEVDGLMGANCRHYRNVWLEGRSSRAYTDEELENIDQPPFEFECRTYTAYEATQKQRQIERTIRKQERLKIGLEANGQKEELTAVKAKIRRLKAEYKAFSKAANLPLQNERTKALYADQ